MEVLSSSVITLSPEERELMLELIDRERTTLPVEIHHTRTVKFREFLKHRLQIVEAIFTRMRAA